jgi:hypothetical protein
MQTTRARFDRRFFLQSIAASALLSSLPACGDASPAPAAPFFTDADRRALGALADHVFPPDTSPGASALGVVVYIEAVLTAFDGGGGDSTLWRSGPFSGRQPFPETTGAPSMDRPDDAFAQYLPLDRVAEAGLRLWLLGSAGLPSGGPNDAVLGPVTGLRDLIRDELRVAMGDAKAPLETLDPADVGAVYDVMPQAFKQAFVELVCEGLFSAPEYGGNKDGGGWAIANFEGDILPLGYSFYDEAKGMYVERAEMPVSSANPGADPAPLGMDTLATLDSLVAFAQGKKF